MYIFCLPFPHLYASINVELSQRQFVVVTSSALRFTSVNNKHRSFVVAIVYNLFSEDVCCTHVIYSLLLLYNGYVGYDDYKTISYFPCMF